MKELLASFAMVALIAFSGCDKGTSGGPGKDKDKDNKSTVDKIKDKVSQAEDTFSLDPPNSTTLKQGETKAVKITIKRGKNFAEDVALKFEGMPEGVTADPASPTIKKGDEEVNVTLKATDAAAVGTFTPKLIGHPGKGKDSTNEMKITVNKK